MPAIEATVDPVTTGTEPGMMKALVYGGPGQRAWQSKPKPVVRHPGDAIVRITTSTICGTDLHIMKGDVPTVTAGRILIWLSAIGRPWLVVSSSFGRSMRAALRGSLAALSRFPVATTHLARKIESTE